MKKLSTSVVLSSFLLMSFCLSTTGKAKKGCHYNCNPQVHENTLTLEVVIVAGDCSWNPGTIQTDVDFGDGNNTSFLGDYTITHDYTNEGLYEVSVVASSINQTCSFHIIIGDSSGVLPPDPPIICIPDFALQPSYDPIKRVFAISCSRTDTCNVNGLFWYATGQPKTLGDSVTFIYQQKDSGSLKTICLESEISEAGYPICKTIVLALNDTLMNVSENGSLPFTLNIFPNPVQDYIQFQTSTPVSNIALEIYSLEGKLLLKYSGKFSAIKSNFIFDVRTFPVGVYLVKVTQKSLSSIGRFVKQ